MNPYTHFLAACCGVALLAASAHAKAPAGWTTDSVAALATAKKEGKSVMLDFTGSDWCPPCIMMSKKVFSKKEFTEAASKNFVLVYVDFPKKDAKLSKKNEPLAEKYKIDTFPTIVLLDKNGKETDRFPATDHPTVDAFLARLNKTRQK